MTTELSEDVIANKSLVAKMADKYGLESNKLMTTLKATAFKQRDGDYPISNEQMAALLIVADQHGLNPFTKEIYAFPDKQAGIVPVVGVDGWSRIANEHKMMDGFEFRESPEIVESAEHKPCPAWMEIVIYRKDRSHPTIVREYFDEVYRGPMGKYKTNGPWQSHTKRMMRHKTLIQGLRVAFSFSGIYDQDEAQRIIEGHDANIEDAPYKPAESEETTAFVEEVVQSARETVVDGDFEEVTDDEKEPSTDELAVDLVVKIQLLSEESNKKSLTKKRGLEILAEIPILRGEAEEILTGDELDMAMDFLRTAEGTLLPPESD